MILEFMLLLAASQSPKPVSFEAGTDFFFSADALTSADYLQLRADGRFVLVGVEHMFTAVQDEGSWHVDGRSVILESEHRVRTIEASDFTIYTSPCATAALSQLRASLRKLRDRGKPVQQEELDALDSTSGDGLPTPCTPSIYDFDFSDAPFPAKRLDPLLAAVDAWLSDPAAQRIFEYQAWDYRGERFLVPMRSGMDAVGSSEDDVRKEMDDSKGRRATYVLYSIPAQEFERGAHCTYAFKFHQEFNKDCNAPSAEAEPDASAAGDGADPAGD